jgi:osmotically-inducible protein OsmY
MMKTETLELANDTFRAFSSYASGTRAGHKDPMDRGLVTKATHALSWLIDVPGVSLCIVVEHRWVTLSGQVDWDYQRCAAVRAMQQLRDVAGVNDEITVKTRKACTKITQPVQAQGTS